MRKKINVQMKKTVENAILPTYATIGSVGADLYSTVDIDLVPGMWATIDCGFAIALPEAYEAQIRARSGMAAKHGITVLNSPGTIDSDYRGSVCVILKNNSQNLFRVTKGMRIAQMVINPVTIGNFNVVQELDETARGEGGLGSTGQ